MRLKGKRVLLTGASSGIGLELARALAARGAVLSLASRNRDRLEEVAGELAAEFPGIERPVVMPCDVSDRDRVRSVIGACVESGGDVDVLINNAGICVYGDTERTPIENFRALMDVNFFGPVYAMMEVLPFMKRRGDGLVVNICSIAAIHGVPYLGAYSATKAALAALSQSLRAELAGTGVRVMIVYPGYTESAIYENELKVGGARRPERPYAPTSKVAESIVRGIEAGKRDLIFSAEGRAFAFFDGVWPWLVETSMAKIAAELREEGSGVIG